MLVCILITFARVAWAFNLTTYLQSDYIVTDMRYDIVKYNKDLMGFAGSRNFKYNRTQFATNITLDFKVNFNNLIMLETQAYKFASNEYRLFPITFPVNLCEALANNLFDMKSAAGCGHMFQCPLKKGHYTVCNWVLDYTKFPPRVPRGQYMFQIKWNYLKTEVMVAQWYGTFKDKPLQW